MVDLLHTTSKSTVEELRGMASQAHRAGSSTDTLHIPLPSTAAHTRPLYGQSTVAPDEQSQSRTVLETRANLHVAVSPRNAKLRQSIEMLQSQIAEKQAQLSQNLDTFRQLDPSHELETDAATLRNIQGIVSKHIKLLHRYNETKDIGLGLMGLIADREGKRLGEVMKERDMDDKD